MIRRTRRVADNVHQAAALTRLAHLPIIPSSEHGDEHGGELGGVASRGPCISQEGRRETRRLLCARFLRLANSEELSGKYKLQPILGTKWFPWFFFFVLFFFPPLNIGCGFCSRTSRLWRRPGNILIQNQNQLPGMRKPPRNFK